MLLLLSRRAGNALGVLGLLFASFESFAGYMTNGQVPDEVRRPRTRRRLRAAPPSQPCFSDIVWNVCPDLGTAPRLLWPAASPPHPLVEPLFRLVLQVNTLAAGAATGMLYRSVRGPRQAAAATVVGTAGAALLLAGRKFVNPGL